MMFGEDTPQRRTRRQRSDSRKIAPLPRMRESECHDPMILAERLRRSNVLRSRLAGAESKDVYPAVPAAMPKRSPLDGKIISWGSLLLGKAIETTHPEI